MSETVEAWRNNNSHKIEIITLLMLKASVVIVAAAAAAAVAVTATTVAATHLNSIDPFIQLHQVTFASILLYPQAFGIVVVIFV